MSDQPVETKPLVDTLPPGEYYDDREDEADLIEDIRRGYLTIVVTVPMENYLPLLQAKLQDSTRFPKWEDWAKLRFHLQGMAWDYLDALSMSDFVPDRSTGLVEVGGDDEAPDPRALRLADEEDTSDTDASDLMSGDPNDSE